MVFSGVSLQSVLASKGKDLANYLLRNAEALSLCTNGFIEELREGTVEDDLSNALNSVYLAIVNDPSGGGLFKWSSGEFLQGVMHLCAVKKRAADAQGKDFPAGLQVFTAAQTSLIGNLDWADGGFGMVTTRGCTKPTRLAGMLLAMSRNGLCNVDADTYIDSLNALAKFIKDEKTSLYDNIYAEIPGKSDDDLLKLLELPQRTDLPNVQDFEDPVNGQRVPLLSFRNATDENKPRLEEWANSVDMPGEDDDAEKNVDALMCIAQYLWIYRDPSMRTWYETKALLMLANRLIFSASSNVERNGPLPEPMYIKESAAFVGPKEHFFLSFTTFHTNVCVEMDGRSSVESARGRQLASPTYNLRLAFALQKMLK